MPFLTLLAGIVMAAPMQSDAFPDIPENHWAFRTIDRLREFTHPVKTDAETFVLMRQNVRSRFAFASIINNEALAFIALALKPSGSASAGTIERELEALDSLPRLLHLFSKELDALGANPNKLLRETAESRLTLQNSLAKHLPELEQNRSVLFRDVPKNHWAYKAVLDLKIIGILDGYPDGNFRGE